MVNTELWTCSPILLMYACFCILSISPTATPICNTWNIFNIYTHILAFSLLEFILVWFCKKLSAYRNILESVHGTNQYWAMSVKFLAQGDNDLPLTGSEPMWLAILRLLARHINHSTTPPSTLIYSLSTLVKSYKIIQGDQNMPLVV